MRSPIGLVALELSAFLKYIFVLQSQNRMFEDYPAAKWILIWSTLPIALVAGFYLLKEWVTNKIKQRSDVAKNGKKTGNTLTNLSWVNMSIRLK